MVPLAGLEPARFASPDFESGASTNSATGASLLRMFSSENRLPLFGIMRRPDNNAAKPTVNGSAFRGQIRRFQGRAAEPMIRANDSPF
jgi:hypothetical protein